MARFIEGIILWIHYILDQTIGRGLEYLFKCMNNHLMFSTVIMLLVAIAGLIWSIKKSNSYCHEYIKSRNQTPQDKRAARQCIGYIIQYTALAVMIAIVIFGIIFPSIYLWDYKFKF